VEFVCKYLALYVSDLQAAESFYRRCRAPHGRPATRRLRTRALPWPPQPGADHEASIGLAADEIDGLRERPPDGLDLLEHADGFMRFEDPFGFRWVLQRPDAEFRSSGQIAGRWLDV
jgi:hypothetical protein